MEYSNGDYSIDLHKLQKNLIGKKFSAIRYSYFMYTSYIFPFLKIPNFLSNVPTLL